MSARHAFARLAAAFALLAGHAWPGSAHADDLLLLSAGAVQPGVELVVASYQGATGDRVRIAYAAAPQLEEWLARGERFDVVIAPVQVIDAAQRAGRLAPERFPIGQVGIGIAVRADAPVLPEIGTTEAVRRELLGAEAVIYNRASTGLAVQGILRELGIEGEIVARSERPLDGAGVMERLRTGHGREIGLGAITEILLFRDRGVRYVGPLPPPLQRFTVYAAALPVAAAQSEAARRLYTHIATAASRASFAAAGVDPPP